MTYDWDGTRTKRVRKMTISVAITVPILIVGITILQTYSDGLAWF